MPCFDGRDSPSAPSEIRKEQQAYIDKLTRMLCWLLKRSDEATVRMNPELRVWSTEHAKVDTERAKKRLKSAKRKP